MKDYGHANSLFASDNHRLSPKFEDLFHCVITLNTGLPDIMNSFDKAEVGFMVKSVDLPRIEFDVSDHNQYNRTVQNINSVSYSPVTMTLHDDSDNNVRNFLATYYSYYIADGMSIDKRGNTPKDSRWTQRDESGVRPAYRENFAESGGSWGLDGYFANNGGKNIIKDIRIYSLSKGLASEYVLINPTITEINHNRHNVDNNALREHNITIKYEAVSYSDRKATDVPDFGRVFYDRKQSSLTDGGTGSIFGQGGLFDTGQSLFNNLSNGNLLSAALDGYKLKRQTDRVNVKEQLKREVQDQIVPQVKRNIKREFPTAVKRIDAATSKALGRSGNQ